MDVPQSTLDKIKSQFQTTRDRKTEVLRVISTKHPQPTWEQVADALYQMNEGQYHSVLERVQSLFPTGEPLSLCPSHTTSTHSPTSTLVDLYALHVDSFLTSSLRAVSSDYIYCLNNRVDYTYTVRNIFQCKFPYLYIIIYTYTYTLVHVCIYTVHV